MYCNRGACWPNAIQCDASHWSLKCSESDRHIHCCGFWKLSGHLCFRYWLSCTVSCASEKIEDCSQYNMLQSGRAKHILYFNEKLSRICNNWYVIRVKSEPGWGKDKILWKQRRQDNCTAPYFLACWHNHYKHRLLPRHSIQDQRWGAFQSKHLKTHMLWGWNWAI